jgi:transcriptional regulator with GAF, ATPase, and Fis domain
LLRPWPGNVRELLTEIRVAAQSAIADGNRVTAHHLAATAGSAFARARPSARNEPVGTVPPPPSPTSDMPDLPHRRMPRVDAEWRLRIEDALRLHAGNVAATARALGLHRTQLRRLIDRHGILVDAVADAGDDEADG